MIASSVVESDSNQINNIFKKYSDCSNEVTASGVWEGVSRDNYLSKSEEFISLYNERIQSQMSSLCIALDQFIIYKELKQEKKRIEAGLASIYPKEDVLRIDAIQKRLGEIKEKMTKLKDTIENLLSVIITSAIDSPASNFANTNIPLGLLSTNSGNLVDVAKTISDNYISKGVTYSTSGSDLAWNNIEKSLTLSHTCCATYVSEILYKSGYVSEKEINSINYNLSSDMYNHFKGKWEEIKSINDLQSGDVVFMYDANNDKSKGIQHVQMYAGNGKWYNAGSTSAIQGGIQNNWNSSRFYSALRPSKK